MKKVLIYVRPFSKDLFTKVVNQLFDEAEIKYISDFQGCGDYWTGDYIYNSKNDSKDIQLDRETIEDICVRDRALNGVLKEKAELILSRFWYGTYLLFKNEQFDYFFTLNVDCYTIDVLLRMAEAHNVHSVSFIGSFMSDYAWFNLKGERNQLFREPSLEEATSVYLNITKKQYLPASEKMSVKRKSKDIKKYYFRRKLIENFYYPILRFIKNDRWNCMYNMINLKNSKLSDFYRDDLDKMFSTISDIKIEKNKSVYLPLHFIPEATTDYWCDGISKLGYNEYIIKVIKESSKNIIWLIKEHPSMYGKRKISFYERLLEENNVRLIHPLERSNDLLEIVDTVVVDNGTVGVEAVVRGKRILALGRNYYESLHPNIHRVSSITDEDLRIPIVDYDNIAFIQKLLDGLFLSNYDNDKKQGKADVGQIVEGCKMLIKAKGW